MIIIRVAAVVAALAACRLLLLAWPIRPCWLCGRDPVRQPGRCPACLLRSKIRGREMPVPGDENTEILMRIRATYPAWTVDERLTGRLWHACLVEGTSTHDIFAEKLTTLEGRITRAEEARTPVRRF